VAGQFYPGAAAMLRRDVAAYVGAGERRERCLGGLCPHAGYMYSGATAGVLFGHMEIPATVVLLGPKHQWGGADYAVWPAGVWRTPLGDCAVDEKTAADLLAASPLLTADEEAHRLEHSLEVVVPFVQYVNAAAAIVPVALGPMTLADVRALGTALAAALKPRLPGVALVVSSDMTHYESAAAAEKKDRFALERVCAMDEDGLLAAGRDLDLSMCGIWPAAVALVALKALGAAGGTILKYTNSGEASGDYGHVVGYAAVAFA
jgi:AmmeMemoRadiSam system protein B